MARRTIAEQMSAHASARPVGSVRNIAPGCVGWRPRSLKPRKRPQGGRNTTLRTSRRNLPGKKVSARPNRRGFIIFYRRRSQHAPRADDRGPPFVSRRITPCRTSVLWVWHIWEILAAASIAPRISVTSPLVITSEFSFPLTQSVAISPFAIPSFVLK